MNIKIPTRINYLIIIILLGFGILAFGSSSHAWRITNDLKQELAAKKAAVANDSNNPQTRFDLAITMGYTNHLIDGMRELKKVNELDPNFKKKSLNIYINKVIQDPADWKLRFRLAFAYFFNGKKTDAIREFKNVLILEPENVWAYGYLSLIYGEIGDIDKAMAWAKNGLKIDSNVAALHLLLGEGYYKKGDSWRGFLERMEALRLKALGY